MKIVLTYKNRDWLQCQYVGQGLTCRQIATICGCHERTIHQRLVMFNIPRRHGEWSWENLRLWRERNPNWAEYARKKRKSPSVGFRRARSQQYRGMGNPNWKGGITMLIRGIRRSPQYYQWRKEVLLRYGGICQKCGSRKSPQAHHKLCVMDFPDSIFDVENGEVLCHSCHKRLNFYHKKEVLKLKSYL